MKKALTIGELLVTLAIIGVIAVLVLPGLIKDYQNKLFTTKFKKNIELIDNAVNQACIDSGVSFFYQTPYSKPSDVTDWNNFLQKYFKSSSFSTSNPFASSYTDIKTQTSTALSATSGGSGYLKLADGGAIAFLCSSLDTCTFIIDVNSTNKPNTGGRDLFTIYLNTETNELYDLEASSECGADILGSGCYANLVENNWDITY